MFLNCVYGVLVSGLKRGFDDYREERDIRRDRREDYIADDGRSRYSEGKRTNGMAYLSIFVF